MTDTIVRPEEGIQTPQIPINNQHNEETYLQQMHQEKALASEKSSTSTSASKESRLLGLPLVVVQDILAHLVCSHTINQDLPIGRLLQLRGVSKFFDNEITKLLGHSLALWSKSVRKKCAHKAPRRYFQRILLYHISCGQSVFANQMQSVAEVLMDAFEAVGTPKQSHEVSGLVCDALTDRPRPGDSFFNKRPEYWNPVPTAFGIALKENFTDVIDYMLKTSPMVSCGRKKKEKSARKCPLAAAEAFDIFPRLPLETAMELGRTGQVEMLLNHGATIGTTYEASPFLVCHSAARNGHEDVVELYLKMLPWNLNNTTLDSTAEIVSAVADAKHWDMLLRMLRRYMSKLILHASTSFVHWNHILREAAMAKQEEVIRYILDTLPPSQDITHPLLGAVCKGHLSTCKLLLEKMEWPDDHWWDGQNEVWTQAIAKGGSIEVYQLLSERNLWSLEHECHFLPIAAEHGHLDFAKLAVKNGWDADPFSKGQPSSLTRNTREVPYKDDVRYFALLRAIVSGHKDVVRWLIQDVDVKVRDDPKLANPELRPVELAFYADDSEMVELLLSLGAEVSQSGLIEQCAQCQKETEDALVQYERALYLGYGGYNERWYRKKRSGDKTLVCPEPQIRGARGLFC